MTGSAPGERAEADVSAVARLRDAALPLGILLVLGITLRLIIAYVIAPGSGLGFDVRSFNAWAANIAAEGPWRMYDRGFFLDYTPGYLYVLWALGGIAGVLGGPGSVPGDLLKLPPMLADLGLAVAVFLLVADLGGSRRHALFAAGLVLAVPVTWIDSAIWSQVDAVGTLVLLLAVWRLGRGDDLGGTLLTTIAAIIKPQFGILIPLAAVLIIRRAVLARDGRWWLDDPMLWALRVAGLLCIGVATLLGLPHVTGVALPESLAAADLVGLVVGLGATVAAVAIWLRDRTLGAGLGRLVSFALVGLGTAAAVCLPFGVSLAGLVYKIGTTAAGYPYVTVNAYNPWALATQDGGGLAANGTWIPDMTSAVKGVGLTVLGIPAVLVGTGLLVAAIAALAVVIWRRPDRRTLVLALAVMSIAFFVLPTRVHERYMFPFFALGAVLAARDRRWLGAYLVLALAATMNLVGVLGIYHGMVNGTLGLDGFFGGAGGELADRIRSGPGILLAAILHAGGLLAAAILLVRPGDDEADEWSAAWMGDDVVPAAGAVEPGRRQLRVGGAAVPGASAGAVAGAGPGARVAAGAGWLRRAWHDRTALLAGEPGGRFGRFDLWLLVVLVVAALCLRTFRLGEPGRMHFDEVYHARTATEFLQDWRYGEPHGIYEYTHPHLAKYAIAGGIAAWGDDRVEATSSLGVPVRDAVIEPRWDDAAIPTESSDQEGIPATRGGERLYVATGTELRIYDLVSRGLLAAFPVPGASALALDADGRRVMIGTETGALLELFTDIPTDELRAAAAAGEAEGPTPYATAPAPVARLWITGDGTGLLAGHPDGSLTTWDTAAAEGVLLGTGQAPGVNDAVGVANVAAVVATTAEVADPAGLAATLTGFLGDDQSRWESALRAGGERVVLTIDMPAERKPFEDAIAAGTLPGVEITGRNVMLLAVTDGVAVLDTATGRIVDTITLEHGAGGLALVEDAGPRAVYAGSGASLALIDLPAETVGGASRTVLRTSTPDDVWMPGAISRVEFDAATRQVHAVGRTPDGAGWTIYVVEPNGDSVYGDAALPFEPVAVAVDENEPYPSADRQQILAFAADGSAAAVNAGQHAFAWRLPGVIAGSLMAGLLFLLARVLFRRRTVAVLVGVFTLLDGMFFVQSRIAMNDSYLGLFMVAGVTLFAAIWTGAWRSRWAFWLGMPGVGVLMGLALASKWVALYAIGALGVLILIRSALGRVVIVLALGVATGVLGWMSIYLPPEGATSGGNLVFLLIMMGLTILAAVMAILHPIVWTADEVRISVALPIIAGTAVGFGSVALNQASVGMTLALLCFAVAAAAAIGFWAGGRAGIGPLAPLPDDDDPASILPPPSDAPDGWLLPGRWAGVPIIWAAVSLLVIPLAVYVISYLPWVALGNQLVAGVPAGHTGQTFVDLQLSMYDYHNGLREGHAASSPWWAWLFNFKPVWFYQGQMAGGMSGAIYDGGNVVLWWLAVPAMAFTAFQAFRRRSNSLGLVAVLIACMWLAWSRIDRATFEYHWYSSLPFVMLALAYFIAEIWHGPSARTWLLARAAAAVALLAPVILWLGKGPLCGIAGVSRVVDNSNACGPGAEVSITLTAQIVGLIGVLVVGGGLVVVLMLRLDGAIRSGMPAAETHRLRRLTIGAAAGAVAALAAAWLVLPRDPLFNDSRIPGEAMALVLLLILGPLAWIAATARSPRRFVIGFGATALVVFLAFYPNWSGLPLPSGVFNYYQGILPTWIYDFQFAVNTNAAFKVPILAWQPAAIAAVTLLVGALLAWVAWTWRISMAEQAEDEATLALED